MKRYHAPADPREAERVSEGIPEIEDMDAFFRCLDGVDKCQQRCVDCDQEYAERAALIGLDEYKEGLL